MMLATAGDYRVNCCYTLEGFLQMAQVEIPNRSLFRQPEVCEIASIQPYVLRTWEAEFPDLGVSRTEGGQRVYRKVDVERVLRIKQLLFVEGLTLAGARRKMAEERGAAADEPALGSLAELFGRDMRERILQVKQGLKSLAGLLARSPGHGGNGELFDLETPPLPKAVAKAQPHQQHHHGKKGKAKKKK
jgi:DNA-binding transcriptional MerR regulator